MQAEALDQPFFGAEETPFSIVVSSYTRAQAIADGVLIDVSEIAKKYGFIRHAVITDTLWKSIVAHGDESEMMGRLRALIRTCYIETSKAVRSGHVANRVYFDYDNVVDGVKYHHKIIIHIGPGDDPEPVITIMMPCDD